MGKSSCVSPEPLQWALWGSGVGVMSLCSSLYVPAQFRLMAQCVPCGPLSTQGTFKHPH